MQPGAGLTGLPGRGKRARRAPRSWTGPPPDSRLAGSRVLWPALWVFLGVCSVAAVLAALVPVNPFA